MREPSPAPDVTTTGTAASTGRAAGAGRRRAQAWWRERVARWTRWPFPIVRHTPWREGGVYVVYGTAYPQRPVARSLFNWHVGVWPYEMRWDVPVTDWDRHCDAVCRHIIVRDAVHIPPEYRERYARVLGDRSKTLVLAMEAVEDGPVASYVFPHTDVFIDTAWCLREALRGGIRPCFTIPLDSSTVPADPMFWTYRPTLVHACDWVPSAGASA